MTRNDILKCVHEPFGDAFYFGPERLSDRYEQDETARQESGFAGSTFKTIFERIEREGKEVCDIPISAYMHIYVFLGLRCDCVTNAREWLRKRGFGSWSSAMARSLESRNEKLWLLITWF